MDKILKNKMAPKKQNGCVYLPIPYRSLNAYLPILYRSLNAYLPILYRSLNAYLPIPYIFLKVLKMVQNMKKCEIFVSKKLYQSLLLLMGDTIGMRIVERYFVI